MTDLTVGQELPEWSLPLTPTLIVSTAIATRDFQDVHHDRDLAQGAGSKDIFMNILTSNGMVERYVTEQVGNDVDLLGIAIRLGAPAYPGDTLTFSGRVESIEGDVVLIHVQATVSPTAAAIDGDQRQPAPQHVTGTVRLRKASQ
jgi:hypothetical protein